MKKPIFLTAILLSVVQSSFAGEPHWAMNVSAGTSIVGITLHEMENIRAYRSSNEYLYDWDPKVATSIHLSFTPEFYLNDKFSLAAGLRLTNAMSKYESNYDYFYYKNKEDGYNTYYYRIKSLSQRNVYVGVPLEFRFLIRGEGRPTPYIRAGVTLNFRCTTASITNVYQDGPDGPTLGLDTDGLMHPADNFTVPVYAAGGIQLGREKSFCFEIQFPYTVAVGSVSGFGDTNNLGGGFQITYQFAKNK